MFVCCLEVGLQTIFNIGSVKERVAGSWKKAGTFDSVIEDPSVPSSDVIHGMGWMPFLREIVVPHLSATLSERCTGERRALSTRRCSPQCSFY